MGWVRSKPYDKVAAYEIAQNLGIYPDELPCLVVFDKVDQMNKVIFPIEDDLSTFFRGTVSSIQRSLSDVKSNDLEKKAEESDYWRKREPWDERAKRNLETRTKPQQDLFDKLRKSLQQVRHDKVSERIIYNFFGQTVFVNHPTGSVRLQDFHNIKKKENPDS